MDPKTDGDKIASSIEAAFITYDGQGDKHTIVTALLDVARALNRLGINNASTEMGAIELLAKEVRGVTESLNGVMGSLDGIATEIADTH